MRLESISAERFLVDGDFKTAMIHIANSNIILLLKFLPVNYSLFDSRCFDQMDDPGG